MLLHVQQLPLSQVHLLSEQHLNLLLLLLLLLSAVLDAVLGEACSSSSKPAVTYIMFARSHISKPSVDAACSCMCCSIFRCLTLLWWLEQSLGPQQHPHAAASSAPTSAETTY
jgi:hypothetical protein